MTDIRKLGRVPRRGQGDEAEHALFQRLKDAKRDKILNQSQLAFLEKLPERALSLMADIRKLGHLPRRGPGHEAEHALADRLKNAKRDKILSHSQMDDVEKLSPENSPVNVEISTRHRGRSL